MAQLAKNSCTNTSLLAICAFAKRNRSRQGCIIGPTLKATYCSPTSWRIRVLLIVIEMSNSGFYQVGQIITLRVAHTELYT